MKKIKNILVLTMMLLIAFAGVSWANEDAVTPESIIADQLDKLNINDLQRIIDSMNDDLEEYIPKIEIKPFITKILKGEGIVSLQDIINGTIKYFFKEVVANWKILGQIIVLSAIYAILSNLQSAFENDVVGKLAYTVCYLVIITITIKSFMIAINLGKETIDTMVTFMQALLPILLAILIAMGGLTTSAFFHPVLLGSIGFIGTIIKSVVLPLILFSAVLAIVNNLSSKVQVTKLASLLKQSAVVILGFVLTAFIGIISIQGITASTVDGITIRTAKFAVDKFIPIVGGFLSDAMDTVIGYSLLLKNSIGVIGLIAIFIICLIPMVKIIALITIYKICSAIVEPISQSQLADCLNHMSNSLVLIFATVSSVAIMFFITITIIVGAGNITVMMR
ncbi:stage III sporulation protein AE [Alkaliphilus sp. MSJ-5]|uniref:Stage III sporulation protein AE n=1 Tax=Alkaliphilus flagellatus TaxID=2841507 RepID=A0ABS6G504_9FIRM|nr:stage III sporulation protein AE [Alkaliphilus flagellatus]MBU5677570.1 stage III sporulation protein AE [Alkaliphilus flagellatus]